MWLASVIGGAAIGVVFAQSFVVMYVFGMAIEQGIRAGPGERIIFPTIALLAAIVGGIVGGVTGGFYR